MSDAEIVEQSDWREARRTERAIARIESAMRAVMDTFGGNLDHPALRFLEAADEAVRSVHQGVEWHEFDCGAVGGGWPHPVSAHVERPSCGKCGWSGQRWLTTPSRARAGGCDDPWHGHIGSDVEAGS